MFPLDRPDHLLDEHRRRTADTERRIVHLLAARCRTRCAAAD